MIVGIPREIKENENRVSLIPFGAEELVKSGNAVLVEKSAGIASGFNDEDYIKKIEYYREDDINNIKHIEYYRDRDIEKKVYYNKASKQCLKNVYALQSD